MTREYVENTTRNWDPGFLIVLLVFACFSLAFPGQPKKNPEPGQNLHISYHTAEPYEDALQTRRLGADCY